MSEQQIKAVPTNAQTILFMVVLSFVCALVLSILASALSEPQKIAKDLDRSKQMMIAAKILDHQGYFLMKDQQGNLIPAKYTEGGSLVPGSKEDLATQDQILDIYKKRMKPYLLNKENNLVTFEEAKINLDKYLANYRATGYYKQPYKLIYAILPNLSKDEKTESKEIKPEGYIIPVNGFGLWGPIYGYLALKPDGNTVIGISWYDQIETPGLGANIAEPSWQNLFPGKAIFQETSGGATDFKTAPLGITVVKGKVSEVLGESPKSKSAVDGMTGATLTGNGVTDAYKEVLEPYRQFFIKLNQKNKKEEILK